MKEKQILAKSKEDKGKETALFPGIVKKIGEGYIIVKDEVPRITEHQIQQGIPLLVSDGDTITKGQRVTPGHIDLKELMNICGVLAAQEYIVNEVKSIYTSQGQTVHSKHIELIVRQMFSRVRILDKGDSDFFPGDITDIIRIENDNARLLKEGKKPAIAERLLL